MYVCNLMLVRYVFSIDIVWNVTLFITLYCYCNICVFSF